MRAKTPQLILSVPAGCAARFAELGFRVPPGTFATHDPPGRPLGSGGGFAQALAAAWRASGAGDFGAWLRERPRVVVHAGGESRRTPAYAAEGKAFIPIPVLRWSFGQRLDQTLLDLQWPFIEAVLEAAPEGVVAAVCSGDVLLQGGLPERIPEADVVCLGFWAGPETASRHGVFFCPRSNPGDLLCMLQKPSPDQLGALAEEAVYLVDTGVWLFRERAVLDLLRACGWEGGGFAGGAPAPLDLYGGVGLGLGSRPRERHPLWNAWSCAVTPLREGTFFHFGTSRQLVESTLRLQNQHLDRRQFGPGVREHPAAFIQNARVGVGLRAANHTLWIENAAVPEGWVLSHSHVLTGIPENTWGLQVPPGVCLDLLPVGDRDWAVRWYGIDDAFRGPLGAPGTLWVGKPAGEWFRERGLTPAECGIDPGGDIHEAPLFPVLAPDSLEGPFLQWLIGRLEGRDRPPDDNALINRPAASGEAAFRASPQEPVPDTVWAERYRRARRLSAAGLAREASLRRRCEQRQRFGDRALERLAAAPARSVFLRTDLDAAAEAFAARGLRLPEADAVRAPLDALHLRMFRAAVRRRRGEAGWRHDEEAAFGALRETFLSGGALRPVSPERRLLADQIVWGRSPVRLDLAGGWTDTPPYCVIHGGCVVNLAVELNGQPPIQVFGRCLEEPRIVLRSIDLGREERIETFEDLRRYTEVGSAFSIPRAALAMAGFVPEFSQCPAGTLREALERFGGGIDVAFLAAVPKGSGLGTSSILAATVLGALSDLCGLAWDSHELVHRTLCLEQMLTTGGGWQDQAGGIHPGLKLLRSAPGCPQNVHVRWLPDTVLRREANRTVLLYYTGITRVAKTILQDIVRSMFLNASASLGLLAKLGENALRAADAAQRQDLSALGGVIRRSWELNCALDAGTNTPAIQALLDRTGDWLEGAKLLGAGGGGYLLMVAKDADAAARVRRELTANPPNGGARFVDLGVSETGLQVTRS